MQIPLIRQAQRCNIAEIIHSSQSAARPKLTAMINTQNGYNFFLVYLGPSSQSRTALVREFPESRGSKSELQT
jgi:hypothetical protein